MALTFESATQQTVEVYDLCVHVRGDGTKDKVYEPYTVHSYPLDSTITLRGIGKLVDGKLVADGDWYEPSGKQTVRYGEVDLGDLNWGYNSESSQFYTTTAISGMKTGLATSEKPPFICAKYPSSGIGASRVTDKTIGTGTSGGVSSGVVIVGDTSYTDATAFKSAMSGIMLVYEKATPTTSTASPYSEVQICDGNGTEEFVTDSVVPVGNVTEYTADLRKQVENIYGIPKPPTSNGSYKLALTVSGGTPTYSWVSDS